MSGSDEPAAGRTPERIVPGVVRVMTLQPVEVPASVSEGQSSLAEQVEERPWLVAAAIVVLVAGVVVVLRRRHR